MAIDANGEIQFTPATQRLLDKAQAAVDDVATVAAQLRYAVFLEEIEDALSALRKAGTLLAERAAEARAAVQDEAREEP